MLGLELSGSIAYLFEHLGSAKLFEKLPFDLVIGHVVCLKELVVVDLVRLELLIQNREVLVIVTDQSHHCVLEGAYRAGFE